MTAHPRGKVDPNRPRGIHWLAGHTSDPFIKNDVVAVLLKAEAPITISEIVELTGHTKMSVNLVLQRLVKKALVERWAVPMERHMPQLQRANRATFQVRLYQWIGASE